ncbi:MAG: nucleotidyltransferase domain-containing protein [Gemmatimonadota bacterium]
MDLESLAKAWTRRAVRQRTERLERADRARESAKRAAAVLRDEFEVDEVWLFGSLAGEPMRDDFDIDLGVRGLRPEWYFAALARVSDVAAVSVDLVTLEDCGERARRAVETSGRRIDEG